MSTTESKKKEVKKARFIMPTAEQCEQSLAKGTVICPYCQHEFTADGVKPLESATCPNCSQSFLVPKKIGKCFLYELAGQGGMGSVYKAISAEYPNKILAVKLLSRAARNNPINVQALLNEARISAMFQESQFLACCLDHGFDNDEYYTVMEFVDGMGLDKLIEQMGKIPEPMLLAIVSHILAAEQHIYRMGYLFRDLKPENVIITKKGYAVLLDFGLCAKVREALNEGAEYVSGSPYYVPPERLLGRPEDIRSEIYSLGMVMYYALTGNTYFNADEINALVKRHLSDLRISNSSKMQGISPKLGSLIARMISQNADERPQSFEEVFRAICGCTDVPLVNIVDKKSYPEGAEHVSQKPIEIPPSQARS